MEDAVSPLPATAVCPECGKEVRKDNISRHRKLLHGVTPAPRGHPKTRPEPETDGFEAETDADESPYISQEKVPGGEPAKEAKRRWFKRSGTTSAPKKAPAKRKARVSTAELVSQGWAGAASSVMRWDVPVGRVLMFQAPVAGDVMDEQIAGTFVDRLIQPLARNYDKFTAAGAMVGVPVCVAMLERKPELQPVLMPTLRSMIHPMLVAMAKGAKKVQRRQEEEAEALAELAEFLPPELMAELTADGKSPVDGLIDLIFAGSPTMTQEEAA